MPIFVVTEIAPILRNLLEIFIVDEFILNVVDTFPKFILFVTDAPVPNSIDEAEFPKRREPDAWLARRLTLLRSKI